MLEIVSGEEGVMFPAAIADTVELSRRLLEILQKAGPECEEELKKLREELCAARKPASTVSAWFMRCPPMCKSGMEI